MAERTPPSWLQGGSHSAENDRNLIGLLVAAGGVAASGDLAVTAPGGTMTISVASGDALVKGSRTRQGVYHCINDAAVTKTIAASDPTNPRYDRVVAEVRDAAYSGASNDWRISVVQGVAAAVPVEPAIPADAIELARITVGAGVSTISNANILDRRAMAGLVSASLVDAKGDLLVGTADNAVTRLPVGTNGQVLTADSTVTGGVKWAASGAASPVVLTSGSAAEKPLVLKGAAGQTGSLQEWQNSAGTALAYVRPDGGVVAKSGLYAGPDLLNFGMFGVSGSSAIATVGEFRGASGQSADILVITDYGGSVKFAVGPTGGLSVTPATTTAAPSAGAAGALPATPAGYMTITVNGTARKVAYY